MDKNKNLENFLKLVSKEQSKWYEHAQWREENRGWLKHSQKIAIKVLSRLNELNLTKEQLSKETNIPMETINNIVKGKENLTLENISKLEVFLQINLLSLQIN
jgi:ribosome-binding protein aMBF1 (putative translation factor)